MNFQISLGDWATQLPAARLVRTEVFINEQKVPVELELDDMDAVCLHAVAYNEKGQAVGTGRLLPDGHIGRMAVRKIARGTGIGAAILIELMQQAKLRGHTAAIVSAQIQAEPFYARYGFIREGEEFLDVGIPHVQKRCMLA